MVWPRALNVDENIRSVKRTGPPGGLQRPHILRSNNRKQHEGTDMHKKFLTPMILLVLAGAAQAQTDNLEYFPASGLGGMVMPFSDAVRAGNLLFVSGKLGTTEDGLVAGGIAAETRQALENIKASLERHGSSMDRVVKCTVFLADMAEWGQMNEVYTTYFGGNLPARSAVGVSGLGLDGRVEIECIGVVAE